MCDYKVLLPAFFAFRQRAFIEAAIRARPSALIFRRFPYLRGVRVGAGLLAASEAPRMERNSCSRTSIRSRMPSARRSWVEDMVAIIVIGAIKCGFQRQRKQKRPARLDSNDPEKMTGTIFSGSKTGSSQLKGRSLIRYGEGSQSTIRLI